MGIPLSTNFTVNTALPIEDRMSVADLAARNAIPALRRWEGMIVYVVSEGKHFSLSGGIDDINWGAVAGGGLSNWLTGTDYILGNVIIQDDRIYQALSVHTSGVFATDLSGGKWKEISSYEKGIDSWITAKAYKIDDVVINANKIYKSLSVHTSGVFDTDLSSPKWVEVSSGGGSGGINYILNPDAETNLNGWATYANTTRSVLPETGTGGSTSGSFLFSRSVATPLRGKASFLLLKYATNSQGDGISYDFTIDIADKGKVLQGSFDYQVFANNYEDESMTVWIYDVTNSRMIQPTPTKIKNSGIVERFSFEFQTSIDSTSYRLIIHQSSSYSDAVSLKFDNFKIGPTAKAYGSAVVDLGLYTPIFSAGVGTPSGINFHQTKIGNLLRIEFYFMAGTVTADECSFTLPAGLSADLDGQKQYGVWSTQGALPSGPLRVDSPARTLVKFGASNWAVNATGTQLGTGAFVTGFVELPIAGWSSSQVMSSDADTRVVAFSAKGTNSTSTGMVPVNFSTVTLDTHSGVLGNSYVVKVPGIYKIELSDSTFTSSATQSNRHVYIEIDGVSIKHVYESNGYATHTLASVLINLKAGQTITGIVYAQDITSPHDTEINIERLSGPSQIAASESVSCLYTGAPPTGTLGAAENVVKYGTKVKDSHGAYNPSTGEYKVPVSGVYSISASFMIAGGTVSAVSYDGIFIYVGGVKVVAKLIFNSDCTLSIHSESIPILQGAVVVIKSFSSRTGAPYFANYVGVSHFSITRTGSY